MPPWRRTGTSSSAWSADRDCQQTAAGWCGVKHPVPAMLASAVDPVYSTDFAALIAPLPVPVAGLTARLVALVAAHPGLSGRVMSGWKSVNFRHFGAGHVCSVLPQGERVALYFEHGRLLAHGDGLVAGDGLKKGRYLRLAPGDDIPVDRIGTLLDEAIALFA